MENSVMLLCFKFLRADDMTTQEIVSTLQEESERSQMVTNLIKMEIFNKSNYKSECEQDCLTMCTSGDGYRSSDDNSVKSECFIGRDMVCKWVKTDFWQSKTRSKNVTTVFTGLKPTTRGISDGISTLF
jgi:hypothetical protein